MKHRFVILTFLLLTAFVQADGQMTRGELLKRFYRITSLQNSGRYAEAEKECEEIITAYPRYPDGYVRMAKVYEAEGDISSAIVYYLQYIDLELDDEKAEEVARHVEALTASVPESVIGAAEDSQAKATSSPAKNLDNRNASLTPANNKAHEAVNVPTNDKSSHSIEQGDGQNLANIGVDLSGITFANTDYSELKQTTIEEERRLLDEELEKAVEQRKQARAVRQAEEQQHASTMMLISSATTLGEAAGSSAAASAGRAIDQDITPFHVIAPQGEKKGWNPFFFTARNARRLTSFGLQPEKSTHNSPAEMSTLADSDLEGKWASDIIHGETGLEELIFSFMPTGTGVSATFDKESGIFTTDHQNLLEMSWDVIKSMWSSYEDNFDIREFADNSAPFTKNGSSFVLTYSSKQEKSKDYVSLGKNILDGAASFIPMGEAVKKLTSLVFNYASKGATQTTYQTTITFVFHPITHDRMKCQYSIKETKSAGGHNTEHLLKSVGCNLYRMSDNFDGFYMPQSDFQDKVSKQLFEKVDQAATKQAEQLFPLAFLHYYGVGTDQDMRKAIKCMDLLADSKDSYDRANAWLVKVCYNLSHDSKNFSRITRKQYKAQAERRLEKLLKKDYVYAWTLKAELLESEDAESNKEEIIKCYKKAAKMEENTEQADPVAICKLGMYYRDTAKNYEEAVRCFDRSAQFGYGEAFLQKAILYRDGLGTDVNLDKYVSLLYSAIEYGSANAFKELSESYLKGLGVPRNVSHAMLARKAYFDTRNNVWKDVLKQYGYEIE